jgi:hypothetical protein
VVLHQVAQAARDQRLLEEATEGREEAERRWKWLRTKVKKAVPKRCSLVENRHTTGLKLTEMGLCLER